MCAVESEMISIFSCNDLLDSGVALARRLRLPFVLGLGGGDPAPRPCLVCSVAQVVDDVKACSTPRWDANVHFCA